MSEAIRIELNSTNALQLFFKEHTYSRVFILTDVNTEKYCLPIASKIFREWVKDYEVIGVPDGEDSKSLESCGIIWDNFSKLKADRKALLVNLGGGMITDLGGFAASVYKRGIDFIHLPTSLLGMIDASLGGKCGINYLSYKNQLGVFNYPKACFIFTDFLKTLNHNEIKSGFVEAIKHALIADKTYFELLKTALKQEEWWNEQIIEKSILIKSSIVEADTFENNVRKRLNFGHTVGHAIETHFLEKRKPISHGIAVAIGIICETYLSHKVNKLDYEELGEIIHFITEHYSLPSFSRQSIGEIITYMEQDKKRLENKHQMTLLASIGECSIDQEVNDDLVAESLDFYLQQLRG